MYTGTLIDQLIATVERSEARTEARTEIRSDKGCERELPGRKTCLLVRGCATGSSTIRIQSGRGGINGGSTLRGSKHAA